MRRFSPFLFAAVILPFPSYAQPSEDVPPAAAPQARGTAVEVFSGAEYQSFDLGDGQDATKLSVPVAARVTAGRFRFSAQVPYVGVSAPGNVIVPSSGLLGLLSLVDPTRPAGVRTGEGLGDVRVGAAYDLPLAAVNLSLIGGAKLPTAATEKGLGTGEADYSVGAEVSTRLGTVTPFASASYTRNGDSEGVDLRDTLSGQAGAAVRLGSSASAHLGYSFTEGASAASRDEQRLFGGVNSSIGERISLGLYGSAGVNGTADLGAGVSLGMGLR